MLVNAYGNVGECKLNDLIREGNYKYLNFSTLNYFEEIELEKDDQYKIQKISKDSYGNILGYFHANVNMAQQKITGTYFVKFRHNFKNPEEDEVVADVDFKQFIDEIMNHPLYNRVMIMAVKDNIANKTYNKFLEKYKGEKFLFKNYTRLSDGKFYDVWMYWFTRGDK